MHTRRLATKTFQRPPPLYPPAPADARDGAALARGTVFWVNARTQNWRKGTKLKSTQKKAKKANNSRKRKRVLDGL